MYIEIKKGRERPKTRWFDVIENDKKMADVCEGDTKDRVKWKLRIIG